MNIIYHYPPELLTLLIDTIPLLCKSKNDTLSFLRGSGVDGNTLADLKRRVATDRENINKYEIVRTTLTRLNEKGEGSLKPLIWGVQCACGALNAELLSVTNRRRIEQRV